MKLVYLIETDEKLRVVDRFSFYSEEILEKFDQLSESRPDLRHRNLDFIEKLEGASSELESDIGNLNVTQNFRLKLLGRKRN